MRPLWLNGRSQRRWTPLPTDDADGVPDTPCTAERVPPLNLTREEAEYLWEMMKEEVGKKEVQYGDDRETVESIHTKVLEIVHGGEVAHE